MGRESSSSSSSLRRGMDIVMKPAWLESLMSETFFDTCQSHNNRRKNEKNIFCLTCCRSFCPHCLTSHRSHPLIQVRRYVYHDVVRLEDLEKIIDCSYIQSYTINSAKVIFLKQRVQSRVCKGPANICFNCDRILQDPFNFCCLSCKVDHMVYQGEDLSGILYRLKESDLTFSQFEGLRMDGSDFFEENEQFTPNSILENPLQSKESSCSSNAMGNLVISQDPEKRKKKKSSGFLPGIIFSLGNRRKSTPQRSPLS